MTPILGIIGSQASTASFESIASTTLAADGTVTFSSIPQTYRHLHLRIVARPGTGADYLMLQANGQTSNVYQRRRIVGAGSTPSGAQLSNTFYMFAGYTDKSGNYWSVSYVDVFDYAQTNKYKMVRAMGGWTDNGASPFFGLFDSVYRQTTAITSLTISMPGANLLAGSTVALYGIKE